LDTGNQHETERVQALRFMRQILNVVPKKFPRSFTASLVSLATQCNSSRDPLFWATVGTLCELG